MKKIFFIPVFVLLLSSFTLFNTIWKNDPAHSQLGFSVTHLGINTVSGFFNDFQVEVDASKADFSDGKFVLTAKLGSLDTRVEARNNHLKSADFFDVEKYPVITFKSTAIKKIGKDKYKLSGDLTIHGVTKPVSLEMLYRGSVINPMSKKQTAGFKFNGSIKRSDFQIGNSFPEAVISNVVVINADGEFIQ